MNQSNDNPYDQGSQGSYDQNPYSQNQYEQNPYENKPSDGYSYYDSSEQGLQGSHDQNSYGQNSEEQNPHEHNPYEENPYDTSESGNGEVFLNEADDPYAQHQYRQDLNDQVGPYYNNTQQPMGQENPYGDHRRGQSENDLYPEDGYNADPLENSDEGYDDGTRKNNRNPDAFEDHDMYAQQPNYNGREVAPEQPQRKQYEPRQHKYSTSNMKETGKCKKYCSIILTFLLFLAVMIGLSMLFNHFFFGDTSDNGPQLEPRPENQTFPRDKQEIDSACSGGTFRLDNGELCKEACVPQFFKCCDPFAEFDLTIITASNNETNTTDYEYDSKLPDKNVTFLEDYEDFDDSECSFDTDIRGCMSYAKCQALGGQVDPAPANLPEVCSIKRLKKDDGSCLALCASLECCYSSGSDNCLAEKFDLCMDYAPCQNLRFKNYRVLETAPRTLDYDCYWQQPACTEECERARCCSDPENSCLQFNFMSCLTYSPCNNVTEINIEVPPIFSYMNEPPQEITFACNAKNEAVLEPSEKSCEEICSEAVCCWESDPAKSCFQKDPLGCLLWDSQCQVLLGPPSS
jgi:hypothetical protein